MDPQKICYKENGERMCIGYRNHIKHGHFGRKKSTLNKYMYFKNRSNFNFNVLYMNWALTVFFII